MRNKVSFLITILCSLFFSSSLNIASAELISCSPATRVESAGECYCTCPNGSESQAGNVLPTASGCENAECPDDEIAGTGGDGNVPATASSGPTCEYLACRDTSNGTPCNCTCDRGPNNGQTFSGACDAYECNPHHAFSDYESQCPPDEEPTICTCKNLPPACPNIGEGTKGDSRCCGSHAAYDCVENSVNHRCYWESGRACSATLNEVCQEGPPNANGNTTASCVSTFACDPSDCGRDHEQCNADQQCQEPDGTTDNPGLCSCHNCSDTSCGILGENCSESAGLSVCRKCKSDCQGCELDNNCQICGDSLVTQSEQCDPGGGSIPQDSPTCDNDCTPVDCGDGHVNEAAGEECDPQDTATGANCNSTCTIGCPGGCPELHGCVPQTCVCSGGLCSCTPDGPCNCDGCPCVNGNGCNSGNCVGGICAPDDGAAMPPGGDPGMPTDDPAAVPSVIHPTGSPDGVTMSGDECYDLSKSQCYSNFNCTWYQLHRKCLPNGVNP